MKMWQKLMVLAIACVFSAAPAQGAWSLVDNFENETLGFIHGQTAPNGQIWNVQENTQASIAVAVEDGSKVLSVLTDAPTYGLGYLNLATPIAEGTSGTLHYRAKLADVNVGTSCSYGVGGYDGADTGHASKTATVGLNNYSGGVGRAFTYSAVTGDIYTDPPYLGDWYEVWVYLDLTAANSTGYFFEAYIAGPGFDGQVQMTASLGTVTQHAFRSYNSPNGITAFSVYKANTTNPSPGIFVDDVYVDMSGKNLTAIPEPASLILLGLGSLVLWRKK